MKEKASNIFKIAPEQWGLRGDPYLWKSMKILFGEYTLPIEEFEFKRIFISIFNELTSSNLLFIKDRESDSIFIEEYSTGGMSSGHISLTWWEEKGYPLLLERINQNKQELI